LIIISNPQAMEKDLGRLFTAIARYKMEEAFKTPLTADLQQLFQHTLDLYKSLIPDFSTSVIGTLISATDLNNLRTVYNL